jgi:TonB family protein
MTNLESFILSYLVNAAWQVPLLFAAGWVAARALRKIGAQAEHRIWVGALLLQTILPACSTIPWETMRAFLWTTVPQGEGVPHVSVVMGAGTAWSGLQLGSSLLAVTAIAYIALTAWFAARFAWRLRRIHFLRRNSTAVMLSGDAARFWAKCSETFGVAAASVAGSSQVFGPVTIGAASKIMLLPSAMVSALPAREMQAAIAHEFAHMQRNDFLKNLIYELLALPITFHPVFWLTRERVMESREMVCDQLAAQIGERHQYARSLLRLASLLVEGMSTRTPHAIGIFDATTFERRVMRLTEKQNTISIRRRLIATSACALLGLGVCASALALSVHVDALAASDEHPAAPNKPVNVRADIMAGNIASKVTPSYPVDAKKAKVQGTVALEAVIGKTGDVEQLKVTSGPKLLQQSALDAVHQWKYKPFLLNGAPVDVKTTINVIYSLRK